jgi:anti-sigma regulatory factor (Ser/Thr protein kinase)
LTISAVDVDNGIVTDDQNIRAWLVAEIAAARDVGVASRAADQFGISRQAVARYLQELTESGDLLPAGQTQARRYQLALRMRLEEAFPLDASFQEDIVWSQRVKPVITDLPANVVEICEYGVTEILNNAKDHSGASHVHVRVGLTLADLQIRVLDGGIGIFKKIQEACKLEDERHALFELSKGRLTTDPEHHTGEGIFFTSRAFDSFVIMAGSLTLMHRREAADWLVDDSDPVPGTLVRLRISRQSTHTITEVFDRYATEQDDYAFRKTTLIVALAQPGATSLVSRSVAKRIMTRCEKFREVTLDFRGVESIGPAFADEIFRVWQRVHPNVELRFLSANEAVEKMIRRSLVGEDAPGESTAVAEPKAPGNS